MTATAPHVFVKPTPRDYQEAAAESYLHGPNPSALIQLPTGTGKTLTTATIFDRFDGRCLFLAHTDELVRQTCRAMLRMGLWPRVEKADEYRGGHYVPDMRERKKLFGGPYPPNDWFTFDKVTVSSMQTFITRLDKYADPELRFDLVCIDECFPSGTLVDGKPIETFRVGDRVTAFDPITGRTGKRAVAHVFRKRAPAAMVRITAGDQSVTATANHPFRTARGWVNAGDIEVGDDVCGLFADVHRPGGAAEVQVPSWCDGSLLYAAVLRDVEDATGASDVPPVRSGVHGGGEGTPLEGECGEAGVLLGAVYADVLCGGVREIAGSYEPASRPGEDEGQQPDEATGGSGEGFGVDAGWRPQAPGARRERTRYDGTGTTAGGSNGPCAVRPSDGQQVQRLSDQLQTGPRGPRPEVGGGDRRGESQIAEGEGSGRAQGRVLERARVDRVEVLERGGAGRPDDVCPDGFVYNLEVEGEHTYLANGFAVHNCHRSRCATYETIAATLAGYNSSVRLLGLTATPYRADKKNLGAMFPAFAYQMPILDAIDSGWLADVRGVSVDMKADTSKWSVGATSHGRDITDSSLRASMASEECVESIAHPIIEKGEGRKGIVFLPGIEASEAVAAAINALKPNYATFVHGKVPKKERRRRIRAFEDGDVTILTGANIFIEGFDVPDVALVVMARPTQSRGLYEQMLGRGLRPLAECIAGRTDPAARRAAIARSAKPNCLVMDLVNNTKFKLVSAPDILLADGDPKKAEYIGKRFAERDPDDKRAIREQLDDAAAMFNLSEALRTKGGPPPRQDYTVRDVNLFGAGGTAAKPTTGAAQRPSSKAIEDAHQFFIEPDDADRMTAGQLAHEIERRKLTKVGRRNYGFLLNNGVTKEQIKELKLNWHDAEYLRRLVKARPQKVLPGNWQSLVEQNRKGRMSA